MFLKDTEIYQKMRYSNYAKLFFFLKLAVILKINDKEELRAEYQDFFLFFLLMNQF